MVDDLLAAHRSDTLLPTRLVSLVSAVSTASPQQHTYVLIVCSLSLRTIHGRRAGASGMAAL